jgi:hypothetical protein
MRRDASKTLEISCLELWHRASTQSDPETWGVFQQGLEETALVWLHNHPHGEAACRLQSERHFVAQAFERLRQAVAQKQGACETLASALVYLRVSLNGAILETLRVSSWPGAVLSQQPNGEDLLKRSEIWDQFQALLPNQREQRLAYLLYHCGLSPAEIMRFCPQEWSDVQEISCLRRTILARLLNRANQLRSWFNDGELL